MSSLFRFSKLLTLAAVLGVISTFDVVRRFAEEASVGVPA